MSEGQTLFASLLIMIGGTVVLNFIVSLFM